MACPNDADKKNVNRISMLHRLTRRKVYVMGASEKKLSMEAWIDQVARVLFPLGYTAFIVSYLSIHIL